MANAKKHELTRSQNASRIRLPKERRIEILGGTALEEGEIGKVLWVRGPDHAVSRFQALGPAERGRVVMAGLEALGLLQEPDTKP